MKLKCHDGKTRTFTNSELDHTYAAYTEVQCTHCGYEFGVHSISAIKDWLREHHCPGGFYSKNNR